jgi:hypothetical protein
MIWRELQRAMLHRLTCYSLNQGAQSSSSDSARRTFSLPLGLCPDPPKDHIQGFEALLEQVTIGEFWLLQSSPSTEAHFRKFGRGQLWLSCDALHLQRHVSRRGDQTARNSNVDEWRALDLPQAMTAQKD